jgi:hypothetical protein
MIVFPSGILTSPSYELEQIAHDAHGGDGSARTSTLHYQWPGTVPLCMEHNDVI